MGNAVVDWVFRRQKFCCCLPARLGTAILSFISILLGGALMVIIWFEVATNHFMSNGEKASFVLAGILETCLFVASVLGFIGTLARKQSFVVAYASFLYVHFIINLCAAIYFLVMVTTVANRDIVKLCQEGIQNTQAEGQCKGLLNITKGVFYGISLTGLAVETYCALIVTRYVNQLRYEKRDVRNSKMLHRQHAIEAFHHRFTSYSSYETPLRSSFGTPSGDGKDFDFEERGLLHGDLKEYDPYDAFEARQPSTPLAEIGGSQSPDSGITMVGSESFHKERPSNDTKDSVPTTHPSSEQREKVDGSLS